MVLIERANYLFVTVASVERRRRRRQLSSTIDTNFHFLPIKTQKSRKNDATRRFPDSNPGTKKLEIKTLIKKQKKNNLDSELQERFCLNYENEKHST